MLKPFEKKPIEMAIVDRGYRGVKKQVKISVLLPSTPLKRDTPERRQEKRKLCQRRAAIEPIIGHLKADYRLSRNWLKGSQGDSINLLMAACAWNLKKWMIAFFFFDIEGILQMYIAYKDENQSENWVWLRITTALR